MGLPCAEPGDRQPENSRECFPLLAWRADMCMQGLSVFQLKPGYSISKELFLMRGAGRSSDLPFTSKWASSNQMRPRLPREVIFATKISAPLGGIASILI